MRYGLDMLRGILEIFEISVAGQVHPIFEAHLHPAVMESHFGWADVGFVRLIILRVSCFYINFPVQNCLL